MDEGIFPSIVLKDNISEKFNFSEVIVFGAGKVGKTVIYMLKRKNISVRACFDNNHDVKDGIIADNILCEKPKLIDRDIPVLVAVDDIVAKKEIRFQCEFLGYIYIYDIDVSQLNGYIHELSDEEYLKYYFWLCMGKPLNLKNPKTFNEKLQWLKLYDRNPTYIKMVDKCEVKKYIADLIGEQYIIPTLGVWDSFEDINFNDLPDQFVLKCTHDSGSVSIISDKKNIEYQILKEKFERALQVNHYYVGREWVYKTIKPKIIAEQYIKGGDLVDEGLIDYKLMCFNGKVRCSFTCTRRFSARKDLKVTFFDCNWKKMPFERHYPAEDREILKPDSYDEMVRLAEQLSKGMSFVRIDFYEVNKHPYFGEMTFYPGSGFEEFSPFEWDRKLGDWIELPERMICDI